MSLDLANELAALKRRVADLEGADRVRGVRARVYSSSNILIATGGAGTALTYDSERYDTDAIHNVASVTTRLTIPFDGHYRVGACVRFASNATGYRQVFFRVNGATVIAGAIVDAVATAITDIVIAGVDYEFTAGDYIECNVVQTSGGNLNVLAVGNLSPEFWIERLIN